MQNSLFCAFEIFSWIFTAPINKLENFGVRNHEPIGWLPYCDVTMKTFE